MKLFILCILIMLCWTGSHMYGMPITDPSQLSPHPTIIDFDDVDTGILPNPTTFGDVTFTSLTGTLLVFNISHWPANGTEVASNTLFPGGEPDSAISITFVHPVAEFLLGWGDPNFPGNVLRAYDANGILLEEAPVELGPIGGVHAAWIGFKRLTTDIAMIIVQPAQPLPNGDDYVIDNIYYNTAVPNTGQVESLSSAILWIGLKNSDDQGTSFDLKTKVYINDTLISDGITHCITGATRNPSRAKETAVPFGPIIDSGFEAGDLLSLKVLTRIGTNPNDSKCPGHNSAVGLRLYYDAVSTPSRFGAELAPHPLTDLFLHSHGAKFLDGMAPTATTATFQDSSSLNFSGGNPWKEVGTWIMTIP